MSGNYKVGYGKPPAETRFRKGVSGNPGGRPRGMTAGRAKRLALHEAYRPITVRERDKLLILPAIQAVMRLQVQLAAKGNGPAQRHFIDTVQAIEQEEAMKQTQAAEICQNFSDQDRARALAAFVAKIGCKLVRTTQDTMGKSDLDEREDRVKSIVTRSAEE